MILSRTMGAKMTLAAAALAAAAMLLPSPATAAVTVSGTVRDTSSAGVAGITAQLWENKGGSWTPTPMQGVTGSAGEYAITGVPAGTYRVSFDDTANRRFVTAYYSAKGTIASANDLVVGSQPRAGIGAVLSRLPVSVAGVVSDQWGAPVAGVSVIAYAEQSAGRWSPVAWAETGSGGAYALTNLPAGMYRIGAVDWRGAHMDAFWGLPGTTLADASMVAYTGSSLNGRNISVRREVVARVAGATRYQTATELVYEQYFDTAVASTDFDGVHTIVIAAGNDVAMTDSLAAAGLAYAYQVTKPGSGNIGKGAPLVLVPAAGTVPAEVKQLVVDIARGDSRARIVGNGTSRVRLVAVGGTSALPSGQLQAIKSYAESRGVTITEKRIAGANRYGTAAEVAKAMVVAADVSASDRIHRPRTVLLANGADDSRFFDALAFSPIAAYNGSPILLVGADRVPAETSGALAGVGIARDRLYIGGGTAAVSETVRSALSVPAENRLAGADRYGTAVAIARRALEGGMLPATGGGPSGVGVAARIPDALTGGAVLGDADFGHPVLFSSTRSLPGQTASFMAANRESVRASVVLGGRSSVAAEVESALRSLAR